MCWTNHLFCLVCVFSRIYFCFWFYFVFLYFSPAFLSVPFRTLFNHAHNTIWTSFFYRHIFSCSFSVHFFVCCFLSLGSYCARAVRPCLLLDIFYVFFSSLLFGSILFQSIKYFQFSFSPENIPDILPFDFVWWRTRRMLTFCIRTFCRINLSCDFSSLYLSASCYIYKLVYGHHLRHCLGDYAFTETSKNENSPHTMVHTYERVA